MNEIKTQDVTTTWSKVAHGSGTYINNGNNNIYIQRNSVEAPEVDDIGALVTVGGSFFVGNEDVSKTYVKSVTSTATIARL